MYHISVLFIGQTFGSEVGESVGYTLSPAVSAEVTSREVHSSMYIST